MILKTNNKDNINKEILEIKSKKVDNIFFKSSVKDLTHLKTYTIDDKDTLEIDDAISLERVAGQNKLWIHIASPATHIDYNSTVDKIASKHISSIYLAADNIYMFPEVLIKEIFSFTNKEARSSISMGVILNNDGSVFFSEIVRSIILPNYQLSYEDADLLIDYAPKEEEDLNIIFSILDKRKKWRKQFGSKEILESYGKIVVNNNIPINRIINPTLSRILISEAMILYGDLISIYTKNNNIPVPYRVQEYNCNLYNDKDISKDNIILNNFLKKRGMGKTHYSSKPLRHHSLGLNSYLHATSPIRRYSDLLVHYQITRFLDNKDLISKEEIDKNIKIINNLSRQNINKYREDQKIWMNKFFEINLFEDFKVIFLQWINRYKNISIIYFMEYSFSSICYLKSKSEIKAGDNISIKNITNDYSDMLYFKTIS